MRVQDGTKRQPYRRIVVSVVAMLVIISDCELQAGPRVDEIRKKGHVACGVSAGTAGFSVRDEEGRYSGFEIEFCRALAAAILGDASHVRFVEVRDVNQFIDQPNIDVVSRRLTWTMRRESENGLLFSPVIFYDGAGFLVRRSANIAHPNQLGGSRLCMHSGSEANRALVRYFAAKELRLLEVPASSLTHAAAAFFSGGCEALVADVSELAAERSTTPNGSEIYTILPERISKEPLSLLMRQGDDNFFLVVRWTVYGLIAAEEAGVTSENLAERLRDGESSTKHLFGSGADIGRGLGLEPHWLHSVIRSVGNYGQVYDRHLGMGSELELKRGLNELWTAGGLMYAPPTH